MDNPVRFAVLINSKHTWAVSENGGLYRNSPNFREIGDQNGEKGNQLTLRLSFPHFDRKNNPNEGLETPKHQILDEASKS